MAAPPTDALDLVRFLALSLELHTDALCCAVDDVEAAIIESSTNDELLDSLEAELAVLLERQRRLHAGRAMIARSQQERRRGHEVRRDQFPPTQPWGDKRIQATSSRATSHTASVVNATAAQRSGNYPEESSVRESSVGPFSDAEIDAVDQQVELLKSRIEALDCYSLRGKLLQLENQKKAVKDVDLDEIVASVVDTFEFPASVRALWSATDSERVGDASTSVLTSSSHRRRSLQAGRDASLALHATGRGNVVNHTNVDLLLARACQRLAGRSVDALEALASSTVSEDSAAAHVLGCKVYAAEFDRCERADLRAVVQLQTMPEDTLAQLYRHWVDSSVVSAKLDARCFGARGTVLAAHDFCALPADWATTQSLSRIPLDELLPPIRHLLTPRFTFANLAELKHLQTRRVELQEKIVRFLVGGQETDAELLGRVPGNPREHAVAAARMAVAETTPSSRSRHAWKTMLSTAEDQ